MTEIIFTRLDKRDKALHVCRWAETFFQRRIRVLIRVEDDDQAQKLDQYLWTWDKGSFLPHCRDSSGKQDVGEAIVIVTSEHNPNQATALIMAHPCAADFIRTFETTVDFAEMYDPVLAQQSRERFRYYRDSGLMPRMSD